MRKWIALITVGLLLGAGFCRLSQATMAEARFYVATNGNDRWSGTLSAPNKGKTDGPFATLEKARNALRADGRTGGTVLVRGGIHILEQRFGLGPQDSGAADRPTVFAAFPGEQPVLCGGARISGVWKENDEGIFSITMPKKTIVEDLFVDGIRQQRARMPNAGFFKALPKGDSKTVFGFEKGQLSAWPDAANGVVVIKPYEWVDFHLPIASIDEQAGTVTLAKPCGYPLVPGGYGAPAEYHVENVRAALDLPGEWCFDRETGTILFLPPEGVNPAEAEIVAGRLPVMVALDGDVRKDQWVEHVELRGLTFRYSGREGKWRYYEGAAIRFSHGVRHCNVRDCRFEDLGGSGVVIWKECVANTVAGCEFVRTGDMCVKVFDYLGEGPPMSSSNIISNNYIHHCGTVHKSISGIGIERSEKNRVANNLIHDMPYNGIHVSGTRFVYWNRKNEPSLKPPYTAAKIKPYVRTRLNIIENNHIHHVMQELYDGGAIYFWGTMGEGANIIRNNLIHHVGTGKRTAVGIYLDDNCDDVHVRDNVVYGANLGMHLHGAPRNLIENNVFAYSGAADISIQPEDYNIAPMNTIFSRNILAWGRDKLFRTGEGWNKHWDRKPIGKMDYNLYWRGGQPLTFGTGHLEGFGKNSVMADPAFAQPAENDFVLQPGEAARNLGIEPIDLSRAGLVKPPAWLHKPPRRKPIVLPLPAPELATLPGWQPHISSARAYRAPGPVTVDGVINPAEWPGWTVATRIAIEEHYDKAGTTDLPVSAYMMIDNTNLYVALRSPVKNVASLAPRKETWGQVEAVEVCFSTPGGPVFVLRGYPSGKLESSTEAGAPATKAAALGNVARFAARIETDEWTGEYQIPLNAAGIDLSKTPHLEFNIGVFKVETREWIAWTGTGGANWQVEKAGRLIWNPTVDADAKELIQNGDLEVGTNSPARWHPLWWNTSVEQNLKDRDPACAWVQTGVAGSHCLEIGSDIHERMQTRQGGFLQQIKGPGPGEYLLAYDLKAENLAQAGSPKGGSFSSYVHIVKPNGEHGANLGQSHSTVRQGTFGWTRFEVPVQIPADAGKLDVIFQFQRVTGTVWVDNVSFKRCRTATDLPAKSP